MKDDVNQIKDQIKQFAAIEDDFECTIDAVRLINVVVLSSGHIFSEDSVPKMNNSNPFTRVNFDENSILKSEALNLFFRHYHEDTLDASDLKPNKDDGILWPSILLCSTTGLPMNCPVLAKDGKLYDKESLLDPITKAPLTIFSDKIVLLSNFKEFYEKNVVIPRKQKEADELAKKMAAEEIKLEAPESAGQLLESSKVILTSYIDKHQLDFNSSLTGLPLEGPLFVGNTGNVYDQASLDYLKTITGNLDLSLIDEKTCHKSRSLSKLLSSVRKDKWDTLITRETNGYIYPACFVSEQSGNLLENPVLASNGKFYEQGEINLGDFDSEGNEITFVSERVELLAQLISGCSQEIMLQSPYPVDLRPEENNPRQVKNPKRERILLNSHILSVLDSFSDASTRSKLIQTFNRNYNQSVDQESLETALKAILLKDGGGTHIKLFNIIQEWDVDKGYKFQSDIALRDALYREINAHNRTASAFCLIVDADQCIDEMLALTRIPAINENYANHKYSQVNPKNQPQSYFYENIFALPGAPRFSVITEDKSRPNLRQNNQLPQSYSYGNRYQNYQQDLPNSNVKIMIDLPNYSAPSSELGYYNLPPQPSPVPTRNASLPSHGLNPSQNNNISKSERKLNELNEKVLVKTRKLVSSKGYSYEQDLELKYRLKSKVIRYNNKKKQSSFEKRVDNLVDNLLDSRMLPAKKEEAFTALNIVLGLNAPEPHEINSYKDNLKKLIEEEYGYTQDPFESFISRIRNLGNNQLPYGNPLRWPKSQKRRGEALLDIDSYLTKCIEVARDPRKTAQDIKGYEKKRVYPLKPLVLTLPNELSNQILVAAKRATGLKRNSRIHKNGLIPFEQSIIRDIDAIVATSNVKPYIKKAVTSIPAESRAESIRNLTFDIIYSIAEKKSGVEKKRGR
ncbi:MAG: hypothetical protein IPP74_04175 [Alphaproteobacteria bacterium]|nr:hypothetical protein [Alphaproteobacteria bacterium]